MSDLRIEDWTIELKCQSLRAASDLLAVWQSLNDEIGRMALLRIAQRSQ